VARPTVVAGYPRAFLDFAVSRGADRRGLIERSGVHPDDLKEQDNRIPLANFMALLKAGIELTGEPALALLFGEAVRMQDISILGLIGEAGGTVEEGRQQMNRYARLAFDAGDGETSDRVVFVREGGEVWLKSSSVLYVENPLLTEVVFAQCVCGARELMGATRNWPYPKAIRFTHEEPSYRAEYDRVFGVPLFFGSHMNAQLVDEEIMSIQLPRANPYFSGVLSAHAEALLKSLESSKSYKGRVESLLLPILHTGDARVDVIAHKLGVSRQTLFRQLKAEGVTFEKVLDELRHKLALHYLSKEKASVNETAWLVGFSEPAAFSRAFKRWTGASPRTMRASRGDDERMGLS
jgi:AraC-like DNA-binding protein